MHETCPGCGLRFEREPGYFVGSIYINYAATAGIALAGFLLLQGALTLPRQLLAWGAFCVAFPLFFFRYARSLWLGLDFLVSREGARPPAGIGPEQTR